MKELAIALGYQPEANLAPRVLAAGEGVWARHLRAIAERHGVPFHSDSDLAELLSGIPLSSEIPADLYPAVAEIFAFLYTLGRSQALSGMNHQPSTAKPQSAR